MSKSEYSLIEKKVSEKIASNFSVQPKFVLGVSGGADSMALLFLFKQLQIDVLVVHINYGLRGEESDKDQELVEGMAFEWGFECCSVKVNSREANEQNFQNWARKERYRIFLELAKEINADGIAVAHHKGDQIETIIQKLFRGSSPETWTGMSEWDGRLFRPLLDLTKEKLLEYCKEKAIPFRTDESNLESKYARNFLRNELSMELENHFPGWKENVLRLQEFGRLNELALQELSLIHFDEFRFNIVELRKTDELLVRALLKRFIEQHIASISKGTIEQAYNLIDSQTGVELALSDSLSLVKDREYLILKKATNVFEPKKISKEMVLKGFYSKKLKLSIDENPCSKIYLDIDCLKFPLILRRWSTGDKIQPLGMKGSQKVSDHLTNRKVSAVNKEKSLVLTDTDGTIYAIIFEEKQTLSGTISEICKATDLTKQYLLITIIKQA